MARGIVRAAGTVLSLRTLKREKPVTGPPTYIGPLFLLIVIKWGSAENRPLSYDSARAGGGALPVIMSIIRSSEKPTTTATTTSECAV